VRSLANILAGAWELTAPQSSALVCSLKASCNRVAIATCMKRSVSKRKEAVTVPATLPVYIPEPNAAAHLQDLQSCWLCPRAFVLAVTIVVRSGGQSVVQARCCLGSWQRLFIAEVREGWKDRTHLASPVKGI
jgi:hypothetical protein